jgi:hypothetical protein
MNLILGNKGISSSLESISGLNLSDSFTMEDWIKVEPGDISSVVEAVVKIQDIEELIDDLYIIPPNKFYITNLKSIHDHFDLTRELNSKFSFPAVAASYLIDKFQVKQTFICVSPRFNTFWHKMQRQFITEYLSSAGIEVEQYLFD